MTQALLKVGDLVYQCMKWHPAMDPPPNRGIGTITMIAGGKYRVLWRNGELLWFKERELVLLTRIVRSSRR